MIKHLGTDQIRWSISESHTAAYIGYTVHLLYFKMRKSHFLFQVPVPFSAGGLQLLLRVSLGRAVSLLAVGTAGLVTPGMSGRQQGGVRAKGELRQSRRNFRS